MDENVFQGMEYVYAVYKEGSFQKAAQKMFISQPSVSASVRRVEERVGCRLFDRSVKPLRLTECGERYIAAVEQIYQMGREFSEYVNDWGGLRRGSLRLGGSSLFSSLVLPSVMSAFHQKYPNVQMDLAEETTTKLEEMLQQGTVDLVLDYQIPNSGLYDARTLEEDALLLAVPASFEVNRGLERYRISAGQMGPSVLQQVPAVPLECFKGQPFIMLKQDNDTRKRADELCAEQGFEAGAALEFDQQMTAYLVSRTGAGISFVSSTLVSRVEPGDALAFYRLAGSRSRRKVCFFWKRGRYLTRAMEEFMQLASGLHEKAV